MKIICMITKISILNYVINEFYICYEHFRNIKFMTSTSWNIYLYLLSLTLHLLAIAKYPFSKQGAVLDINIIVKLLNSPLLKIKEIFKQNTTLYLNVIIVWCFVYHSCENLENWQHQRCSSVVPRIWNM